jgi:transposase-like protein
MADDTKKRVGTEAKVAWSPETLEAVIRWRIRETIETVLEAELDAALGVGLSARVGDQRRGYRHGTRTRTLTTSNGPTAVAVPRARLREGAEEFRRRTKTQASLPSQDAVVLLLFGLLRAGHIRVRKIDGWQEMPQVTAAAVAA